MVITFSLNTTVAGLKQSHVIIKVQFLMLTDSNIYAAQKYFVSADQVPLIEVSSPKDAFVALVEVCFVFDLEYPPQLPLTMEFFER